MVDIYIASLYRSGSIYYSVRSLMKCKELTSLTVIANNWTCEQLEKFRKDFPSIILKAGDNKKGCSEKLRYFSEGKADYIATCDDDIIYPETYLSDLIKGVEKHQGLVSFHGRVLKEGRCLNYYKHKKAMYHCAGNVSEDVKVDIAGSGVAMIKRNEITGIEKLYKMVKFPNMTDIYFSWYVQNKGYKCTVLKHNKDYFKFVESDLVGETIFDKHVNNCEPQTQFINKLFLGL